MAQKELVLGGGCFWCLEAVYEMFEGVSDVVSGYANGSMANPNYRSVCSGTTGHAEVVKIVYEDSIISTRELLEVFFTIHDPTTLNAQGADIGTQYRSTILFEEQEVEELAYAIIDEMQEHFDDEIVTVVEELDHFYEAEKYHQDYYRHNPTQGYCMAVIAPKVAKAMDKYKDKIEQ
ncbi:MAG: peptide-methionine (S)-S-oxide reductase MsrA [Campylobacterales bacterium]|nr:peptide-methionine (S)-S-oxide reductase MsrA [Campylobacterales bacterium]